MDHEMNQRPSRCYHGNLSIFCKDCELEDIETQLDELKKQYTLLRNALLAITDDTSGNKRQIAEAMLAITQDLPDE